MTRINQYIIIIVDSPYSTSILGSLDNREDAERLANEYVTMNQKLQRFTKGTIVYVTEKVCTIETDS